MAPPAVTSGTSLRVSTARSVAARQSLVLRANPLVDHLVEELAAAWQQGERPTAEEVLARHPDLQADAEAAAQVVYEEFCQREQCGLEPSSDEVVRRFPQWQAELEVLFNFHHLIKPVVAVANFPAVGDRLGDFQLLAELGRGALGRVFLAVQPALARRPVVLKCTPRGGQEHLSLARLQHSHIVPLYAVEEFPARNLQVMVMPYLGGLPLARLLDDLAAVSAAERSGAALAARLDGARQTAPVAVPDRGEAKAALARADYPRAVCRIGACLAEALQYAHERGLVHLDLKPSNVLLAADGEPLLLDFHLAREPIEAGKAAPEWLGGTPEYMSPEQRAALAAVRDGRPVPQPVDGRSDVYSLGLVLYEALGGPVGGDARARPRLDRLNAQVGVGLADIVHKCLAEAPADRYPDAGSLAADLRRHLDDLPHRGVRNRSLTERWRKWRRRRPWALWLWISASAVVAGILASAGLGAYHLARQRQAAQDSLHEANVLVARGRFDDAENKFKEAREFADIGLMGADFKRDIDTQRTLAQRRKAATLLHWSAEMARFLVVADPPPLKEMVVALAWVERSRRELPLLTSRGDGQLEVEVERAIREDLVDAAVLGAEMRLRIAPAAAVEAARRDALRRIDEVEQAVGTSPVLARARREQARALGQAEAPGAAPPPDVNFAPSAAWEHVALGRTLLVAGDLPGAHAALVQARRLQPEGFWPNFYAGLCSLRQKRYPEAVEALCVAVGQTSGGWFGGAAGRRPAATLGHAPLCQVCLFYRARAYTAEGRTDEALADYDRVTPPDGHEGMALGMVLAATAALNRADLRLDRKQYERAEEDLQAAQRLGADPAAVRDRRARIQRAQPGRADAQPQKP